VHFQKYGRGCLRDRSEEVFRLYYFELIRYFQLHFFYSEAENGIKAQVWCTLIAHLLLQVISVLLKSKKAFSTIAALIRTHLISHLDLNWGVTEGRRAYIKRRKSKNKSPTNLQLILFYRVGF